MANLAVTNPPVINNTITINTCDSKVTCENNEKCKWGFRSVAVSTLGISALMFAAVYRKEIGTFVGSFITLPNLPDFSGLSDKVQGWKEYIFQNPSTATKATSTLFEAAFKPDPVFSAADLNPVNQTINSVRSATHLYGVFA